MPMWMCYSSRVRVPFPVTNIFTASEMLRHCIAFKGPNRVNYAFLLPPPLLITPAPNAYALAAKRPPRPSARHRSFGEQPTAAPHFFLNHRGHDGAAPRPFAPVVRRRRRRGETWRISRSPKPSREELDSIPVARAALSVSDRRSGERNNIIQAEIMRCEGGQRGIFRSGSSA